MKDMNTERVFEIFQEISQIPRGSYHNEKISSYLTTWADQHGLARDVDDALNVVIRKPGTKGYEKSEGVILQGHMDMVCQSIPGWEHDYENEGLELFIDGDLMGAKNTTLGADDGIAIAMALAVLESDDLSHPPLEVLITTDEEVGMLGAAVFECKKLTGKKIINIDSEEEGTLLVSCAGGMTERVHFEPSTTKMSGYQVTLVVDKLKGGHSGTEIQNHRTNATNLLGRILYELPENMVRIATITGGDKDNVITNRCEVILMTDNIEAFFDSYDVIEANVMDELATSEPDLEISVEYRQMEDVSVLTEECQKNILTFINQAPAGVQVMSSDMDGVVESSLNMGMASLDASHAEFGFSIRSQKKSYKNYLFNKVAKLAGLLGGTVSIEGDYPAWDYRPDSKLRDVMAQVYKRQYGKEPVIVGIHAGLECGIFYEGMEDVDIVSIGADTFDIHTPKERLSISSTRRVYEYLVAVLEELR